MNTEKMHPKHIILVISIVAVILIVIFLYFIFLHPVVQFLFPPANHLEHITDLRVFEEETYLNFEYGSELKNYVSSISLLCDGKPVGFYYGNNDKFDSLAYGKISDIMAVDIQLNDQAYEKLQNDSFLEDYQLYNIINNGSYKLYYPKDIEKKEYLTFFALNDEKQIFRGILITDTEEFEYTSDITGYLFRWSLLSFE